jgi:hypothetical protein
MRFKLFCLLATGALWLSAAFAQNSIGGPNKPQNYVGGTAPQQNMVVPLRHGGSVKPTQSTTAKPKK